MAMTAFYMGTGVSKKRHGEPHIERVDKNGTEHWLDYNCPKCGGSGYLPGYEHSDGARCWKCGATGYHPHRWTVYTPEYAAKLDARRKAKAKAKNLAERAEFLARAGFGLDGKTYVVIGKTFDIKDELKAAGARFNYLLNWHFPERPENYPVIELTVEDCFWENAVGALNWHDNLQELIRERTPREPSASEYLGEVGKRMTITVTLKKSFSFDSDFGTTYIHNFEDAAGNVIIWKTSKNLTEYTYSDGAYAAHELVSCELTGTVKEHSEYRGTRQTVLTRCKIANEERA